MADVTFTVTVASSKFYIGSTQAPPISLDEGKTYKFDQADSSNSGHTLQFKKASGASEWTTGITKNGTPGNAGAYTVWVVSAGYTPGYGNVANHALNFLYYSSSGGESYGNTVHIGSAGDSDTVNPLPATGSAISISDIAWLQQRSLSNLTFSSLQSNRHSEDGGSIGNSNIDLSDTFGGNSSRS